MYSIAEASREIPLTVQYRNRFLKLYNIPQRLSRKGILLYTCRPHLTYFLYYARFLPQKRIFNYKRLIQYVSVLVLEDAVYSIYSLVMGVS